MCKRQACILLLRQSFMLKKLKAMKMRRLSRKSRSVWVKTGRSDMWWANLISGLSPEEVWKNFCMDKAEFLEFCNALRPYISPKGNSPNYRSLALEKKVAIVYCFIFFERHWFPLDDSKYLRSSSMHSFKSWSRGLYCNNWSSCFKLHQAAFNNWWKSIRVWVEVWNGTGFWLHWWYPYPH